MLLALAGCDQKALLEKFASPQDQEVALSYIAKLRAGKLDDIASSADPSIAGADLRGTLLRMAALIPAGEPTSRTLVGVHTFQGASGKDTNLTYQYQFDRSWVLINVATRSKESKLMIVGMNGQPIEASLEELNAFGFQNKSAAHYVVFAAAALNLILTLVALVLVFRHKYLTRKWAWYLFVLVGAGQFVFNWTTGEWVVKPIAFLLFSAGAISAPYGAWTLSLAVPLGAILVIVAQLLPSRHARDDSIEASPETK